MKNTTLILSACCLLWATSCQNANDKGAATTEKKADTTAKAEATTTPEPAMDSATMMKKWAEYMTPGAMHKMMASMDGKWVEETTMWMGEGAPPTKTSGMCENKMVLGGRYQQSVHKGSFNGMPFEGMSTLAYDNTTKKFISTWIDNMGTGLTTMEGTYDSTTKTITFKGKMVEPTMGKESDIRQTIKFVDDKNQVMEMFGMRNGKEYKSMEMKLTKKG